MQRGRLSFRSAILRVVASSAMSSDPRPEGSHSTDVHDERDPERIALDVNEDAREQAAFEQEDSIIRALSLSRTSSLAAKETVSFDYDESTRSVSLPPRSFAPGARSVSRSRAHNELNVV